VNAPPSLAFWFQSLAALVAGSTVAIVLTALVSSRFQSAVWERTLWRSCIIGLLLGLAAETFGVAGFLSDWIRRGATAVRAVDAPEPETISDEVQLIRTKSLTSATLPLNNAFAESLRPKPQRSNASAPTPSWLIGIFWILGTSLIVAWVMLGKLLLYFLRLRCRPLAEGDLARRIHLVAGRLQFRRPLRMRRASSDVGPAAFGILWPTLLLPRRFESDFDPIQQEAVVAHELAHLSARDPAWLLLSDLVGAALWWQPLVWYARQRLRVASELAADEASLVVANGPQVLAGCLVEIGSRLSRPRTPGWLAVTWTRFRSSLGRRVERLAQFQSANWQPPGQVRNRLFFSLGAGILAITMFLSSAWAGPLAFREGDSSMKPLSYCWQRSLAGLAVCIALGSDAAPPPDQDSPPPDKPVEGQKVDPTKSRPKEVPAGKPVIGFTGRGGGGAPPVGKFGAASGMIKPVGSASHLRIFRLKHLDPHEVSEVLEGLLPQAGLTEFTGQGGAAPPVGGPPGGGLAGMQGGLSGGFPPGGGNLGIGGGIGGLGGMLGALGGLSNNQSWRLAVVDRSRSLIVRGTEKDLQIASDLVAVIDLPANAPVPKVSSLLAFRLKHANAQELSEALQTLELDVQFMPFNKTNTLIIAGPEGTMKEVGEVIEALDVASKEGQSEKPGPAKKP
jgi:beta-lactamase regulating signal transducer with metallopeptidase domain